MDLRALRCKYVAGQYGVVLPAIQAADPAVATLVDVQADGIAVSPDRVLVEGRLDLAMAAQNATLPADEQQRAIDAAEGYVVALGHADHDIDAGFFCRFAEEIGSRPGDLDRIVEIFGHRLPCRRPGLRVAEERVSGQPSLAKGSERGPHRPGLADQPACP